MKSDKEPKDREIKPVIEDLLLRVREGASLLRVREGAEKKALQVMQGKVNDFGNEIENQYSFNQTSLLKNTKNTTISENAKKIVESKLQSLFSDLHGYIYGTIVNNDKHMIPRYHPVGKSSQVANEIIGKANQIAYNTIKIFMQQNEVRKGILNGIEKGKEVIPELLFINAAKEYIKKQLNKITKDTETDSLAYGNSKSSNPGKNKYNNKYNNIQNNTKSTMIYKKKIVKSWRLNK